LCEKKKKKTINTDKKNTNSNDYTRFCMRKFVRT